MSHSVSRMRGGLVRLGGGRSSGVSFQSVNCMEIRFFPLNFGCAPVGVASTRSPAGVEDDPDTPQCGAAVSVSRAAMIIALATAVVFAVDGGSPSLQVVTALALVDAVLESLTGSSTGGMPL